MLDKILNFLFIVFLFIISIDPGNSIFKLKIPLFLLILVISIILVIKKSINFNKTFIYIFLLLTIIPIFSICYAEITSNLYDVEYATGHIKSLLFIGIFFTLTIIDFDKILKYMFIVGSFLAIVTLIIYIYIYIDPLTFQVLYNFTKDNDIAMLSIRNYYGFQLMGTYLKTGPLIFFSYVYALYFLKKNLLRKIMIFINLFAILVAGSRVPMLIGIFITLIYIYNKMSNRILKCTFISTFSAGLIIITVLLALETTETSNMIKFGNFNSYMIEIFKGSNPILGAGLGSVFWGEGFGKYISYSELTYLDILRIYGLILGSILIFLFYYPTFVALKYRKKIKYKYKQFCIAYFMYMILAGTNPVLISSTGMFVYSVGMAFVYQILNNNPNICNAKTI